LTCLVHLTDIQILDNEKTDSETIYRAAVTLGNLVSLIPSIVTYCHNTDTQISSPAKGAAPVGELVRAKQLLSTRAAELKEKRLTDLATEISSLAA
jgi:phospholipase A-2-activating protein